MLFLSETHRISVRPCPRVATVPLSRKPSKRKKRQRFITIKDPELAWLIDWRYGIRSRAGRLGVGVSVFSKIQVAKTGNLELEAWNSETKSNSVSEKKCQMFMTTKNPEFKQEVDALSSFPTRIGNLRVGVLKEFIAFSLNKNTISYKYALALLSS